MKASEFFKGNDWELEVEEDDVILDVIVLIRAVSPDQYGKGQSTLIIDHKQDVDPIVKSGMLHRASIIHERDEGDD